MRTYKLQPEPHYSIYTGHTPNNLQYIITSESDSLMIVEFSAAGTLQNFIEDKSQSVLHSNAFKKAAQLWIEKLGLTLGTIEVKKFNIEDPKFEIQDLPSDFEEYLLDKSLFSIAEQEDYNRLIQIWQDNQKYVLAFEVSDFWVDRNGVITDS